MYFYDLDKKSFLIEEINIIPDLALPISEEQYKQFTEGLENGCEIIFENNMLTLSKPKPGIAYIFNGKSWVLDKDKQQKLINEHKQHVCQLINAKRDYCVNGGVYIKQINKWVDTDKTGQDNLVQIKADFDLNGKEQRFSLICADNTVYLLDFNDFIAVWNAVRDLKTSMYENAYMHKVLLQNSDNPIDYDWSIGWSKTYAEFLEENKNEK
ncbi:Uncharacterised protein [Actinobacillus lignieresii]|uniref:DUF4376 domain-containing protein n=1 Tax=Actinobacillus lignieresii TaxID=720 RepID=UPI000E140730|nr:DUF4376 domain-containing protein [Actinobacillus lignieresii]SUT96023.1 Uncharacterised protein [Actinobacillus lignieresii]